MVSTCLLLKFDFLEFLSNSYNIRIQEKLQGYPSRCAKPPDDFTTKVPFGPGQAQAELLF